MLRGETLARPQPEGEGTVGQQPSAIPRTMDADHANVMRKTELEPMTFEFTGTSASYSLSLGPG